MQREIHIGWDRHESLPATNRVFAECPDEQTEMLLMNPTAVLVDAFLVDQDVVAQSPAYRLLIEEHLRRCDSCQRWEAA